MSSSGFPIVLSADRTQLADYRTTLDGMVGAGQTTSTPMLMMDALLAPAAPAAGLRAVRGPLGLRRIEAALLAAGFSPEDVAIVPPEKLPRAVGPATRIIALSSGAPLGLGMNTNTMTGIAGGSSWTTVLFRRLLADARRLKRSFPALKLVVGGPGAWQLARDDSARRRLGVDHLLTGYFETDGPALFRRIAAGENLPDVIHCNWSASDGIPPIRGATVMGVVEISRGCGLGCDFCTIANVPMTHLAPDAVLADVRTNLAAGVRDITLMSEDFFRYGGRGAMRTDPPALLALLRELRSLPGLRVLQPAHANISSIRDFSDAQLREVHSLLAAAPSSSENSRAEEVGNLAERSPKVSPAPLSPVHLSRSAPAARSVWANVGIETASGRLLQSAGSLAKMRPFDSSDWAEASLREVKRLAAAGFTPMISLIFGLPGETPDDLDATRRWMHRLRDERLVAYPLFLASIDPAVRSFGLPQMTARHWRLFEECYRFNFRWNLRMLWEEESQARVGLLRRLVFQLTGRAYILWWKMLLALRS